MINVSSSRIVEILLVEDNNADVRLIQEYFKDEMMIPHHLNIVKDGLEAMKYLRNQDGYKDAATPDIILLDLHMPRMDGREVLRQIKMEAKLQHIVVGVMTTNDNEAMKMNMEVTPSTFYVTKPVDAEKFMQLIEKAKGHLPKDIEI